MGKRWGLCRTERCSGDRNSARGPPVRDQPGPFAGSRCRIDVKEDVTAGVSILSALRRIGCRTRTDRLRPHPMRISGPTGTVYPVRTAATVSPNRSVEHGNHPRFSASNPSGIWGSGGPPWPAIILSTTTAHFQSCSGSNGINRRRGSLRRIRDAQSRTLHASSRTLFPSRSDRLRHRACHV